MLADEDVEQEKLNFIEELLDNLINQWESTVIRW